MHLPLLYGMQGGCLYISLSNNSAFLGGHLTRVEPLQVISLYYVIYYVTLYLANTNGGLKHCTCRQEITLSLTVNSLFVNLIIKEYVITNAESK